MLQAIRWGTWPTTASPNFIGRKFVKCNIARNALVVPQHVADGVSTGLGCTNTGRPSSPMAPAVTLEKPLAGRITPQKLAALSKVLHLPVSRVETVWQSSPVAVQQLEPEHVAQRLKELCGALGLRPRQAVFMVSKQPSYMLLTPLSEIRAKIHELAVALAVPAAAVMRTALTAPSILRRSTAAVQRRVQSYSLLLRCASLDVLHVMARGPEYLSDTPSSVRQRMKALGFVLRRPRCTIAAMLQARPDLVCMSAKVMNTKVNGLMCILNKQKHHVVTLVVKTPALLRCDLDRVRIAFGAMQVLLRKREGFVYAMVCHAPNLLLLTPRVLHQRCTALQQCLAASSDWSEQYSQLRPPGVAQFLLNRRGSLCILMYLTLQGKAGSASLEKLLAQGPDSAPAKVLGESLPDFLGWMERRRLYAALRVQQRRAALQRPVPAGRHLAAAGVLPAQQLWPYQTVAQSAGCAAAGLQPALTAQESSDSLGDLARSPSLQRSSELRGQASGNECSSSSRDVESAPTASTQQTGVNSSVVSRSQQPGASTSGRQLSWLQLQASYRESLRRRSKPSTVSRIKQVCRMPIIGTPELSIIGSQLPNKSAGGEASGIVSTFPAASVPAVLAATCRGRCPGSRNTPDHSAAEHGNVASVPTRSTSSVPTAKSAVVHADRVLPAAGAVHVGSDRAPVSLRTAVLDERRTNGHSLSPSVGSASLHLGEHAVTCPEHKRQGLTGVLQLGREHRRHVNNADGTVGHVGTTAGGASDVGLLGFTYPQSRTPLQKHTASQFAVVPTAVHVPEACSDLVSGNGDQGKGLCCEEAYTAADQQPSALWVPLDATDVEQPSNSFGSGRSVACLPVAEHSMRLESNSPRIQADDSAPGTHLGAVQQAESTATMLMVSGDGAVHKITKLGREARCRELRGSRQDSKQEYGAEAVSEQEQRLESVFGLMAPR